MEKETFYDTMIICFIVIIGIGLFQAFEFQQKSIQPLELSMSHLDRIISSSEPQMILSDIELIKQNVPNKGNPVFIYPTDKTDFGQMQVNLDIMITSVVKTSGITSISVENNEMMYVRTLSLHVRDSLMDAKPYLYASLPNVFFTVIWLVGTIGLVETLIRKTEALY